MKYTIKSVKTKEIFQEYKKNLLDRLEDIDFKSIPDDLVTTSGLIKNDFIDAIASLKACSTNLDYLKQSEIDFETGEIKPIYSVLPHSACHIHTWCPTCAASKRNKVIQLITPYIKTFKDIKEKRPESIYFYMGVITQENCKDVGQAYDKLRQAWTDFNKLGQRRHFERSGGEASKFLGSLLSIEAIPARVKENGYHVHGHCLLITDKPLDYVVYDQEKKADLEKEYGFYGIPEELLNEIALNKIMFEGEEKAVSKLSLEWYGVSGALNFKIKPIKEGWHKGKYYTLEKHIYEIVKYLIKPWELDNDQLLHCFDALHGKRRITKAGFFANRNDKYLTEFLEKYNALDLFNKYQSEYNINKEEIDEDEEEEQTPVLDSSIYKYTYSTDKKSYNLEIDNNYESYKAFWDAMKPYRIEKANFVHEYRNKVNELKEQCLPYIKDKEHREKYIKGKKLAKSTLRINLKNSYDFYYNAYVNRLRHPEKDAESFISEILELKKEFKLTNKYSICEQITRNITQQQKNAVKNAL